MARIQWKAKIKTVRYADDSIAYRAIEVPKFARRHCDMAAFRAHPAYGWHANSDLFPGVLAGIRRTIIGSESGTWIRLDRIPQNVTIDESGFLAICTVEV